MNTNAPDLFSLLNLAPPMDGETFSLEHDAERLTNQLARVTAVMSDGRWRTLSEIQALAGGSEAGVSARLRDMRKSKFGGYAVERRRRGEPKAGLWEYRVTA